MPSESGGDSSQAASENEDAKINSESPSTSPGLKRHGEIDWRKWGMGAASMKAWVDRRQVQVQNFSSESRIISIRSLFQGGVNHQSGGCKRERKHEVSSCQETIEPILMAFSDKIAFLAYQGLTPGLV